MHACALQGLDEVQAYILLRRWRIERGETSLLAQHLGPEEEGGLTEAYLLERTYALKSLELALQHSGGGLSMRVGHP